MADSVLIDDDDVVMVDDLLSKEPIVIVDEDDEVINNDKTLTAPSVSTQKTIVLDDETPTITGTQNTASNVMNKQQEKSFVNNLENNRLIDKIVTRCITMDNATGMPRVVYKTLLPLYRDASNRFKESNEFRRLLKKTYKQLMKDPDHKFLHVQTLCEELKSGGLRRKVPFVTLATNLKKRDSQSDSIELTNNSEGKNQNSNKNVVTSAIPEINRRNYTTSKRFGARAKKRKVNQRDRIETRSVTQTEKTDIIDLDDSETESTGLVGSKNDDDHNDVIIVEETEPSDQRTDNVNAQGTLEIPKESNKVLQVTSAEDSNKENNVIQDTSEKDTNNQNTRIKEKLEASSHKNNKVTQPKLAKDLKKQTKFGKVYKSKGKQIQARIETDSYAQNKMIQETLANDSNRQNKVIPETLEKDKPNKSMQTPFVNNHEEQDKVIHATIDTDINTQNKKIQETFPKDSDRQNKGTQATLEKDANKQNQGLQDTLVENDKNGILAENEMDYDLLIPKNRLEISENRIDVYSEIAPPAKPGDGSKPGSEAETGAGAETGGSAEPEVIPLILNKEFKNDYEEIAHLEKRIAYCKKCIDRLEEEEVTTESSFGSAYYICARYKEDVVACYKRICQLTGNSQEIVKRREIRLQVTKGHPPGPAKRLEDFLNRTIDGTGAVAFPDFSEVLKCVVESNLADNLAWNNHQIMQEAVALFRQCGQALRKRRQKREYRDLMGLIRDKEETDDPAERDPILLAKLEENKRIAKAKEEQLLDSYVAMEQGTTPHHTAEFDSDKDSSDLECESEQASITNTGACSSSNGYFYYLIPNNLRVPSTMISNNNSNVVQSPNTNNVFVNNLVVTPTLTATPVTQNPILFTYLVTAPAPPHFVNNVITTENQPSIQEGLIMDDNSSNKQIDLEVLPANTRSSTPDSMSECETNDDSDIEEKVNPETELTITETTVGFNIETSEIESDISKSKISIENTDLTANNRPCNVSDILNTVSSSTDGIEQNCDSSISPEAVLVKTEDHVKSEPLDIQNMLDELGDGFVCQVFDIEDPFLVIEISSDESTDDEEL